MNQKGFANIVLIVLVIVLAGVASYFALVKKSPEVAQQTPTPTPTQTKTPTPTTPNETANWKTYSNSKYKISVKYPPVLAVKEIDPVKSGEASAETGNLLWVNIGDDFTVEILSKKPAPPYDYVFENYSQKQQITFGADKKSLTAYLNFNTIQGECYGVSTVRGSCKDDYAVPVQGQRYWYIFTGVLTNESITENHLKILLSAVVE